MGCSKKRKMEEDAKHEQEIEALKKEHLHNIEKLNTENSTLKRDITRLEHEIEELKQELKESRNNNDLFFKKCTEKAIDKPTTSVNTLNNVVIKNCLAEYNLTKEMVRKVCERKGTVEHLTNGISGVADLIRPMIEVDGKPMLMMSDASRSCLKYMKDGNIELDSGANMFIQTVKKGAFSPFQTLYKDAIDEDENTDTLVSGWQSIKGLDNEINKKNFLKALHIPSKSELKTGEESKEEESEESEDEREKKKYKSESDSDAEESEEDEYDKTVKPIEEKVEQKIEKVKQVFLIPFSLTEEVLYDAFIKGNILENGVPKVIEILIGMIHGEKQREMIVSIFDTLHLRYIVNGKLIKDRNGELFMNLIRRVIVALCNQYKTNNPELLAIDSNIIKSLHLPWCYDGNEIHLVNISV